MRRVFLFVEWLMVLVTSGACVAGCGGGKPEGPSLTEQYQSALKELSPESKSKRLVTVANKQLQAGDSAGFAMSLGAATKAAVDISDAAGKSSAWCDIAEAQATGDRRSEAEKLLKDAIAAAGQVSDPIGKLPLLVRIAEAYGKSLKDTNAARDQLADCEKLVAALEDPIEQTNSSLKIALAYQRVQASDDAERMVTSALSAARALPDVRKRADALAEAAATLHKMQRADEARQAFDEAQQVAMQVEDGNSRGHALLQLAKQRIAAGHKDEAKKLLDAAESASKQVGDTAMRGSLQEEIAKAVNKL